MTIKSLHTPAETRRITALMRDYSNRYLAPSGGRGEIMFYGVSESTARSIVRYSLGFGSELYTTSLVMVDPRTNYGYVDLTFKKLQDHGIGSKHKNHADDIANGIIPTPYHDWTNTATQILSELIDQGYGGHYRTIYGTYKF